MSISTIYTDLNDTITPSNRFNNLIGKLGKINTNFVTDAANAFQQHVNTLTATEQRQLFALWQGNGKLLTDYIDQVNAFATAQTPEKKIVTKYTLTLDAGGNILVDSTVFKKTLANFLLNTVSATDTTAVVELDKCYTGTYDLEIDYERAGVVSSAKTVDISFNNVDGKAPVTAGTLALSSVTSTVETLSFKGVKLTGQDRILFTYRGLVAGDVITIGEVRLSDV